MKVTATIFKLFKAGALLSVVAMIMAVTIQVFARFFLSSAPHWTEEAARIFFIYSVAFGTALGIKNGDFIRLDLVGRFLNPRTDRLLNILTDLAIFLFSMVLVVHSLKFVSLGMDEYSPSLKITMGFVFFSMVLVGLSIAIFTCAHLYNLFREKK